MSDLGMLRVWGFPRPVRRAAKYGQLALRLFVAVLGPWIVLGLAAVAILGSRGYLADAVAIVVSLLISCMVVAAVSVHGYKALDSGLAKSAPDRADYERVKGLMLGFSQQLGLGEGELVVAAYSMVNAAAVAGRRRSYKLIVTSGALRELDLLELEALVARELAQVRLGLVGINCLIAFWDRMLFRSGRQATGWQRAEASMLDAAAVSVTRYPPAMTSLVRKAFASLQGVASASLQGWLWMIPVGYRELDADSEMRLQALEDEFWALSWAEE